MYRLHCLFPALSPSSHPRSPILSRRFFFLFHLWNCFHRILLDVSRAPRSFGSCVCDRTPYLPLPGFFVKKCFAAAPTSREFSSKDFLHIDRPHGLAWTDIWIGPTSDTALTQDQLGAWWLVDTPVAILFFRAPSFVRDGFCAVSRPAPSLASFLPFFTPLSRLHR